jgi:hypothetical protein
LACREHRVQDEKISIPDCWQIALHIQMGGNRRETILVDEGIMILNNTL